MCVRGIRGATVVDEDEPGKINQATRQLLMAIQARNPSLASVDIGCVIFTITKDLAAAYPAQAARDLGWTDVPLLCAQEAPVPGSLARCIRVLIQWNTSISQHEVQHVYLGEAAILRPDLVNKSIQEKQR